jgi:hypothetical protein
MGWNHTKIETDRYGNRLRLWDACSGLTQVAYWTLFTFDVTTSYVSIYRATNQKSGDVTCELEEEFADVT